MDKKVETASEGHLGIDDPKVQAFIAANIPFLAPDQAIMHDHRMNPRSSHEERALARPGREYIYSEIRNFLQGSLEDNWDICQNMCVAPAARFGDMTTAIFTGTGDHAMAAARGVIGFCSVIHYPVRFVIKYFKDDPQVGIHPGDGYIFNDSFYGGIHPPDQCAFAPVFYKNEVIAWVACGLHQGEDGGTSPGGMTPDMESPFDEGLKMPPIKVRENYNMRTDILTFIQNSTRDPRMTGADIKTRLAVCKRLEEKVLRAVGIYGVDDVVGALRQNIEYVRDEVARRISKLPDCVIRQDFYLDSTMREDALMRLPMVMTIKGDRMTVDFRGASPQIGNRPINSPQTSLKVIMLMGYLVFVWPDLPRVNAMLDPIEFITDPKSICDATKDVPTALNMQVFFKGITQAHQTAAKAYFPCKKKYAKTISGWFNQPISFIYGGITQNLEYTGNLCGDLNAMPGGAHCDSDGEHSICPNFAAMADCGETEDTEMESPFMQILSKVYSTDNLGFGKYRSGAGYQTSASMRGSPLWGFASIAGGSKFPTVPGLYGGYGSPVYPMCKIKNVDIYEELERDPSLFKADVQTFMNERPFGGDAEYISTRGAIPFELCKEGELYLMSQGAGGGYGDVLERDPHLVIKDVEEGIVSHAIAHDLFFVCYDEKTLVVDEEATRKARDEERRRRIARGKPFDAFVKEWVRPEPPQDVPYYGAWGEERSVVYADGRKGTPETLPMVMLPDPRDVRVAELEAKVRALQAQLGATASVQHAADIDPRTSERT